MADTASRRNGATQQDMCRNIEAQLAKLTRWTETMNHSPEYALAFEFECKQLLSDARKMRKDLESFYN